MKILFSLILANLMLATTATSQYRNPDITKLMFKVDKITLDRDHVRSLSRTLITLAQRNTDIKTEKDANAMFIAISIRLNPKNEQAFFINQRFINELDVPEIKNQDRVKALRHLVGITRFLARAKADTENHKLSLYLKDALSNMNPEHEIVKDHTIDPKRWENVLRPEK